MKKTTLLLVGLILVVWLLVGYWRKPIAATDSIAVSTKPSNARPGASFSSSGPAKAMGLPESDTPPGKPGEEVPADEGSWAKELRELKELAAKDPDAALAQVTQMSDKEERKAAARAVCLQLAPQDPAKAMTAAWGLGLGHFADEAVEDAVLEHLAKQWAEVDLVKAFVWASALPADEEWRRDRVVKGIAMAVSQIAPAEAARLVAEHINPDSSVQIEATMEVLRQWAARDYDGAVDWVALFPDGPFLDRGIGELAKAKSSQPPSETKPD